MTPANARRAGLLALAVVCLWLLPSRAAAQSSGAVNGVVSDDSGAVLPGATVNLVNTGTGQTRTATSGSDGFYSVPLLQPGTYRLTFTLQGFSTLIRDGVKVTVSETARVNARLEVGGRAEDVTVVGDVPLVETANATMGIVIDEKKVVELPLNGRNFTQLGTLIPGVVAPPAALGGQAGDAQAGANGFGAATAGFNVNGMRNQSNSFLLDGANNNDTFNTGFVLRPPPDAIQEFKILTHSYGAEYGRNAGSIVNVVTKSGSNVWRGAAWEFNRNEGLNSRNHFAPQNQPKPELSQNQFGASLGGPIAKDKLFAFAYYEGFRSDRGITQTVSVPTAAQRAGNFGATAIRDPLTGQPFPDNTIPANRISPVSRRLIDDFVPLPNVGANLYTVSPTVNDSRDQFGMRLDYRLSDKHSMLARYLWSDSLVLTPRTVQPADQQASATLQDVMLSDTYFFGSNAINVARFNFNRIYANPAVTSGKTNAEYGIGFQNTNPLAVGLASMIVTGFPTLGDPQQPFVERVNNAFQFSDDLNYMAGRHALKFGFEVRKEYMKIAFINRPNGDLTFSGQLSGNAFADFLLGLPAQSRATTTQALQEGSSWTYSLYAQDEFHLSNRLTLNVGLRYELPRPFYDVQDAIVGFHTGVQSQKQPQAPKGLVYPGDPGVPRGIVETDKNNLAPRLAVVFDPKGDGKTSVRASWGIFYDTLPGQGDLFQSGVLAPPFTPLVELNSPTPMTIQNPLGAVSGGPTLFPPSLTIIGWGQDFESPKAHHFNLGVQRQLGKSVGVEVAYVGSRGKNLPIFIEVNPGVYSAGQAARGARIMPAFALVRPTFSVAESWYDSLQASVRMRPTRGLSFLASYTWAHALDHVSGLNIGGESRPILAVDQNNPSTVDAALADEKGAALFDVRQRFVFTFGLELPKLQSSSAAARAVLGGWQLNGIFQAQTGFPFTVTDSVLSITYLTQRPNLSCDPNNGPKTEAKWFATECFVRRTNLAETAAPGNQGRNVVRGPGFNRTDLSLFKNFNFGSNGRHQVQFRLEAFNLFDQVVYGRPGNAIGTATFGQITTADDGRTLQLGLKYSF